MAKFHINGKGEAGACKATKGGCPFGGENEHFTTAEAARKHFEKSMSSDADTYNVSWSNEDRTFDSGSLSLKDARAKRQGLKAEGISATLTPENEKTKALVEELRWAIGYAQDSSGLDANSEIAKAIAKNFPQTDQATLTNRVTALKKEWADRTGPYDEMPRSTYIANRLVEDMKVTRPNDVLKSAAKYEAPREDGTRAFVLTISGALGGGTQKRTVYAKTASEARQRTARSLPHLAKIKSVVRKPAAGTVLPEPVDSRERAVAEGILEDQDYERLPNAKAISRLSTGQWQTLANEQDAKKKAAVTAYLEAEKKTGYSRDDEGTMDFVSLEAANDLGSMRKHVEILKGHAAKDSNMLDSYESAARRLGRLEKIVKPGEEKAYIDKRRAEHNAVTELNETAELEQRKLNLLNSITEKSKG